MTEHRKPRLVGLIAVGIWAFATSVSQGQPAAVLIGKGETWRYSTGRADPPRDWMQVSFDDSAWKTGRSGFGYGDADDETVLEDMRGHYTAVYIRKDFRVERTDAHDSLYLYVNYDDGFIAYLNGKRVASASMTRDDGGIRVAEHEAGGPETFIIPDAKSLLRPGGNVLAIEGHNVDVGSSDFSLDPMLASRDVGSLTPADYLADVDELERRLLDQSSYLTRLGFDHAKAFAELRRSVKAGIPPSRFASEVRKLVMQIGDCHAGVLEDRPSPASGSLPLRPADTSSGIAALRINQDQPLDPECPYLESIDAIPLERWLDVASRFVPRGSPQLVRRRSLERLGEFASLREELGLAAGDTVTIGLRSAGGERHATRRLRATNQGYAVAHVRLHASRLLAGGIGYLRIPAMDDRLTEPAADQIKSYRATKGMIIDVRDNSGGTYGLMRGIYGFFVPDGSGPIVTNVAAYRLSDGFARDHIEYRPTHRADWEGWDDRERDAIRRASAAFMPEWQPPDGKFSEWHYMILSRERSGRGDPSRAGIAGGPGRDYFYYDKPVVVLSDAGSFSATDGFLNAFAELPGVTIVGEPSGGGSGSARQFRLRRTRLVIALSSMASFRPGGKLFDGRGIEVDVAIKPSLEDYTTDADSVLAKGVEVIDEKSTKAGSAIR